MRPPYIKAEARVVESNKNEYLQDCEREGFKEKENKFHEYTEEEISEIKTVSQNNAASPSATIPNRA